MKKTLIKKNQVYLNEKESEVIKVILKKCWESEDTKIKSADRANFQMMFSQLKERNSVSIFDNSFHYSLLRVEGISDLNTFKLFVLMTEFKNETEESELINQLLRTNEIKLELIPDELKEWKQEVKERINILKDLKITAHDN